GQNFVPSYLKLAANHDVAEVERKMNEVLVKHGAEKMKALGIKKKLSLELVKDVYLLSDVGQSPRINSIYIVASIAFFILLLACINFMNLSTAKATKRAAEIGVRKVLGAFRSSLIYQLLGEAMILVLIAVVISLVMIQITLPGFNTLTAKEFTLGLQITLPFVPRIMQSSLSLACSQGVTRPFIFHPSSLQVYLKDSHRSVMPPEDCAR